MSARIERPRFYEQQILAASDLDAQVEYARNALARHERYQHIWGVLTGLSLSQSDQGLEVSPGVAVDGTGRQLVLPEIRALTNLDFVDAMVFSSGHDEKTRYPVFIIGFDEPIAPSGGLSASACAQVLSKRDYERVIVRFDVPGSELRAATTPNVASGLQGAIGTIPWPVLLGFVEWDKVKSKISKVESQPRYAGVYGDVIAGRGGAVTVRTSEAIQLNKPVMALTETGDWRFQVGLLDTEGAIQWLMALNEQGDLEVKGKLKGHGSLESGQMLTESGTVSDGMTIALPAGVTPDLVSSGAVIAHVIVSPLDDPIGAPTPNDLWSSSTLECRVDPDFRAHCRKRWVKLDGAAPPDVRDRAASCSYVLIIKVN